MNRHDSTQLIPLIDRVPPVRGQVGRPRRRPERLSADRGYDYDSHRRQLRQRGITPEIARRNTGHGSGLGRHRWVVSAPSPGSTNSNACSSATTATTKSTKHSSRSAAASSASEGSRTHFDSSSKTPRLQQPIPGPRTSSQGRSAIMEPNGATASVEARPLSAGDGEMRDGLGVKRFVARHFSFKR